MKITVDIDCTPEEARTFLGLPDVQPLQQAMMKELEARPELGLLGWEGGGIGNPSVMIQYWESAAHLMGYARAKEHEHLPAWSAFQTRVARTDARIPPPAAAISS